MAYLHCHNCDWEQDDFWSFKVRLLPCRRKYFKWRLSWGYNPIGCFFSYFRTYLKPRRIHHDTYYAAEVGWKRNDPHSWYLIGRAFKSMCRKFKYQVWWTYKAYMKEQTNPLTGYRGCPKCKTANLDID